MSFFSELFGSPNPIAYPGVKFRRLASLLGLPPLFELQIRVDTIPMNDRNGCEENYEALLGTIPSFSSPKSSGHHLLIPFYALLPFISILPFG